MLTLISLTSTSENPSSWITVVCKFPLLEKVLARLRLELGFSAYMTDTLPTELLTSPTEMGAGTFD